ncbi:tetratricopeptide repeat protein [Nitrosospira sp. Is2]|uniref:tetratricopeptide repeat protein n=1 Tax=Nitrosospira sp. Is2 TaxID=3080532 RepID=UPI0029554C77|nr:tetratricopeptide repeat protein [Nitrosospira sp. Is2]WON73993.1 tetratricopeptide repeat protein [Nitrosospira sp. Is2]
MNLFGNLKKTILSFGLGLALVFALLFYEEDRLKKLFQIAKPDHLSVLYLRLLLNIKPDDAGLRTELARQHINLGELREARNALEPLQLAGRIPELSVRLLVLELDFYDYSSVGDDGPDRKTKLANLKNSIIEISKTALPLSLLPSFIKLSLELEQTAVVADLYYRWSAVIPHSSERMEKLKESARWYMAAEMPRKAAEIYDKGYKLAENKTEAREFSFLTLKALQAAGDRKLALEHFRNYQQLFPEDPELLDEAISINLADNNPRQAYEVGVLRLSLDPDNPEQIRKQVDRALGVGELQPALALAQRLVEIAPADGNAHEKLGTIAEWALMPEVALKEWLWLAKNRKDDAAITNALRLSKGLHFVDTSLDLLLQLSNTRKLAPEELNSLLFAYSEAGTYSDHVDFLKSYLKRYPDNSQAWEALAKTQEDAGRLSEAMETWELIGANFNRRPEATAHQAKLTWKNGQSEKALSMLLSHKDDMTAKETHFWEILGELSWELKQPEHSLSAYSVMWKSGNANVVVAERLIQLTRDMGRPEDAIAIGEEAYLRFDQSRWLLLAMDAANQAGSSAQLKRLLKTARSKESQFLDSEMYWLMQAQLQTHESRTDAAIQHYQQALNVNPASTTAKEGILWNLIAQNDKRALRSHVKAWRPDASKNQALWGVYGLALVKVGQHKEALPWFERKSRISPDDYLWLLTYADVLGRAGRADAAWRLRKYVLFNIRSRLKQIKEGSISKFKDLLRPEYMALVRDMEGANADISILKQFLDKGYDDPGVQELLVASYLTQENYTAARYWLLQEHIARQETPAWQRLALALAENDRVVAERILENDNDQLTDFNRMETLKRLDKNEEALALTYKLLASHKEPTTVQTYLFNVRDDLIVKTSKQVAGGIEYKTLGDINFVESRVRLNVPYGRGLLATELKHNLLDSSNPGITLPARNELDIMTEFKHPLREGLFQVNLGGNLRDVDSLVYGAARVSQDVTNRLKASLRLGVNEMSHETGALRALGKKDTILLGVSAQLSQQTFFNVDIDGHRYASRDGGSLGKGYKLQMILGHSLLRGIQDWQIRLQGSWENNQLAATLPSDLSGLLSPSLSNVQTLIPKKFALMGIGTSFRYGPSDQGVLRRPFILADAWVGGVWPANDLGYNGRLSMGTSLFGPDILSAGAFYSNVQGGRTDQAFAGVGVQYSFRF